jgi:hypothetical protein
MPLPTLEKTWQHSGVLSITPSGVAQTDIDNTFILIKDEMLGFGWTCVGSCDGVTYNMSGTDLLIDAGDIVHNPFDANPSTNDRSWIVMRQNGTGIQVLFSFDCPPVSSLVRFLPSVSLNAGFTGGSVTSNPTATDEIDFSGTASYTFGNMNSTTGMQTRAYVMHSTDGMNTRVVVCGNGNPLTGWFFERASGVNPISPWNGNCAHMSSIGNSNGTANDSLFDLEGAWIVPGAVSDNYNKFKAKLPDGTSLLLQNSIEASGGSNLSVSDRLNFANELDSTWDLYPIGLTASETVGQRGRHGYIPDLWIVPESLPAGDCLPAAGTRLFAKIGNCLVFPWGGGVAPVFT